MKRGERYPVKIVHGGERLYIHPIAVDVYGRRNQIHFFDSPEFPPYDNDYLLTPSGLYHQCHNPVLLLCLKLVVVTWRYVFTGIPRGAWLWRWLWDTSVPFLAVDVYEDWFSVDGQLRVVESDDMTEAYYLNPSQKWLSTMMEEWVLHDDSFSTSSGGLREWYDGKKRDFLDWKRKVEEDKLSVVYLCSLDT